MNRKPKQFSDQNLTVKISKVVEDPFTRSQPKEITKISKTPVSTAETEHRIGGIPTENSKCFWSSCQPKAGLALSTQNCVFLFWKVNLDM